MASYKTMRAPANHREAIKFTLRVMRDIVRKYKKDGRIRELAISIVAPYGGMDFKGEAVALQRWVQKNIRYVRDVFGVETLQTPDNTLRLMAGDCDDQAILFASLASSIGMQIRFRAVGRSVGVLSHVLAYVLVDGRWLAAETIYKWPLGMDPPGAQDEEILDV